MFDSLGFLGGGATSRDELRSMLRRIEAKIDIIMDDLGLEYTDPASPNGLPEDVKALADDPRQRLAAIKLLRAHTGASLREAKQAIDGYVAGGRGNAHSSI